MKQFFGIPRGALRRAFISGLVTGAVFFGGNVFAVYTQPTRHLVLDEVITAVPTDELRVPLYLTRQGWYFAEIYLEPGTDAAAQPASVVQTASRIAFTLTIVRRDRVLLSEAFDIALAPGDTGQWLLRMKTPWDLPQKKNLSVLLRFDTDHTMISPAYRGVRLQIRKEPGRVLLRP